jgi:iron complex outermembrane receptor protein
MPNCNTSDCPKGGQRLRFSILAITLAAVVIFAGRATAEGSADAVTAPKPSNEAALAEIVVTAQKRTETVQTTPLSITALGVEQLASEGITSANGLAQAVPGMAISSSGPGQGFYEIRGLSADGGEAPTVGFYLDEISVSPPLEATQGKVEIDPELYDLERVEVLRGPQGTLYGAGSMGGTIKLLPRAPKLSDFEASAESILSGTEGGGVNYAEKGMVNLPLITDKVALRIVGSYGHDSGYIDRVVVPNFPLETNPTPIYYGLTRGNVVGIPGSQVFKGVNDNDTTTARVSLLIKPTDSLTITPSVFYQSIHQDGINAYDSNPGTFTHYQPFNIPEPFSDIFTVDSLTVNYDADLFSVTSATGYWKRQSKQVEDSTESIQNAFLFPSYYTAGGLGIGPAYGTEIDATKQFSQEIRITSRGEGNFKWLVGGYYSDYRVGGSGTEGGNFAPGLLTVTTQGGPFTTDIFSGVLSSTKLTQEAGFGNASYTWNHLTLTLGARYFTYTENALFNEQGIVFTGSDAWSTLPVPTAKASGVLPLVNLSYAATGDLLLYASAAKGYREGAGITGIPVSGQIGETCLQNLQTLGLNAVPTSYNPDTVWTYEAGEKGRFFDGLMTLNADVYITHWSHTQQFVSLPCGVGFTTNGSDAEVKGAELELRTKLTDSLSLTQNIGFSHAVFLSALPDAGVVAGQSLFDAPEWTISTTLQYVHPISTRLKMFAGVSNSFVSEMQELTYSLDTVPRRDITNARLGVDGGKWSVALFVNNAFNQRKPTEYFNLLAVTGPPYDRIATNQPLTAGVDINVSF